MIQNPFSLLSYVYIYCSNEAVNTSFFTQKSNVLKSLMATVGEEPTSLAIGNNFQSREIVVPSIFETSFCFLRKVFFFLFF